MDTRWATSATQDTAGSYARMLEDLGELPVSFGYDETERGGLGGLR